MHVLIKTFIEVYSSHYSNISSETITAVSLSHPHLKTSDFSEVIWYKKYSGKVLREWWKRARNANVREILERKSAFQTRWKSTLWTSCFQKLPLTKDQTIVRQFGSPPHSDIQKMCFVLSECVGDFIESLKTAHRNWSNRFFFSSRKRYLDPKILLSGYMCGCHIFAEKIKFLNLTIW